MNDILKNLSKNNGKDKTDFIASCLTRGMVAHVPYIVDGRKFINLYSFSPAFNADENTKTVVLSAHHDVVHQGRDNCQDNNASCYNLIKINNMIDNNKLKYHIIIAWVDAEETVSERLCGIRQLIETQKIDYIIDVEISGKGKHLAGGLYGNFDLFMFNHLIIPANNAAYADRIAYRNRIDIEGSACITLVDDDNLAQLEKSNWCEFWGACHQKYDTFEKYFSDEDTKEFQRKIFGYISK